ncbi:hypothetical protein [Glycomyces harbinensis]|uniref:tRNA nuclease CdiA C-terminal domain-containing protein n=1 Tax=Glycomyces harbinensis TaxID=58114 RepID=A0A1G7DLH7_9ACTN|nr:hypothetical protein [Glycomyces harbinensis]SDE52381.1 hypothetical protein SAMN05216270_12628 [Glycomyces harbinensis]
MRRTLKLLLLLGIGLAMTRHHGGDDPSSTGDGTGSGDGTKPTTSDGKPAKDTDADGDGDSKTHKGVNAGTDAETALNATDQSARAGRATDANGDGKPDVPTSTTSTDHTSPSKQPDPNATPGGTPAKIEGSGEKKRSLRRENESAQTLAENGYDVVQNPGVKPNGKDPDYEIEGETFDCYAPKTSNPDNIRSKISEKVNDGQTDRVILNLDDSNMSPSALKEVLDRRPLEGLKEIKVIKNGQITNLYP